MNLAKYFKLTSYAVVACGALSLLVSDGINLIIGAAFVLAMFIAWKLEDSRWQISERLGLGLILLSLPLFYLDWQYQAMVVVQRERAGAATLAHLILGLAVIKLWQKKTDRDWVFLYLISFFEVLLAAGLSISPLFLASLVLYLLFASCTVIAFEVMKSQRDVKVLKSLDNATRDKDKKNKAEHSNQKFVWRLPFAALAILMLVTLFAFPLFFMMPRVGGAGLGGRNSGGVVGFSENVKLGEIGFLQQNNQQVAMRVRVDDPQAEKNQNLKWRGVALDFFNNKGWRKSVVSNRKTVTPNEKGIFEFGKTTRENLSTQTIYLEPMEPMRLFGAGKVIGIQGSFPIVYQDSESALSLPSRGFSERLSYTFYADTSMTEEKLLRADKTKYPAEFERYLQLPQIDSRIATLAADVIENKEARNRYDAARAIEKHLQTSYGYTLEMKAGGQEPLADFLFRVKEGHCEYFASAMAIMLRTQGIATRIVNGFQTGEYNDTADAYIVTQGQAHSWVEVYFPETDSWVTFDPTPAAGRNIGQSEGSFLTAQVGKYLQALEMFWLQYVVGYDTQGQRGLARQFVNSILQYQSEVSETASQWREQFNEWWKTIRGEKGAIAGYEAIGKTAIILFSGIFGGFLLWLALKRLQRLRFWKIIAWWNKRDGASRVVEFYERMCKALAKQGLQRQPQQTPLEFALAVSMPEVRRITEAYNRVRFGERALSEREAAEIEVWLRQLEKAKQ